jgi:transcriptional regulator with XRE-family HTH domain
MAILHELSNVVKRQRSDMGLSQERLAELAGLSRATINELETGKLTNLSLTRAERLANVLGFGLGMTGIGRGQSGGDTPGALETAARTGSISYGDKISAASLRHALLTGAVPPNYIAQLRALLDEAPLSVLSAAAAQIEVENGVPRKATWQNMRKLAAAVACTRPLWQ